MSKPKLFCVLEVKRPDKELAIGRYTTKEYDDIQDALKEIQKYMIPQTYPEVQQLIDAVYVWAGRPTKDGAKLLRAKAAELEEKIKQDKGYLE